MERKHRILSVDDNVVDGALLDRAFKRTALPVQLFTVMHGQEAFSYLNGEGIYSEREAFPLPDLILLGISMPRVSGFEVLKWLRERAQFRCLPVIILSASDKPADKAQAMALGADAYLVKPNTFDDLQKLVRSIHTDWLDKTPKNKLASRLKTAEASTEVSGKEPFLT